MEIILLDRYDLKKYMPDKEAHSLATTIIKDINAIKTKAMYVNMERGSQKFETRVQVKQFNIDTVILHFQNKIESQDKRFMKSWKRNLRIVKKIKDDKIAILEDDSR